MRQIKRLLTSVTWVGLLAFLLTGSNLLAAELPNSDQLATEAEQIHKAIAGLPDYDLFDWVSFDIQGSTVILNGFASRPMLKKEVQRVVAKVPGVDTVMNNIRQLPLSTFDDQLRTQLYFRIYGNSALSRYNPNWGTPLFDSAARRISGLTNDPPPGPHPIHIIVDNGRVILKGVVATEGDRVLVGVEAKTTPGVFSVDNQLVAVRGAGMKME